MKLVSSPPHLNALFKVQVGLGQLPPETGAYWRYLWREVFPGSLLFSLRKKQKKGILRLQQYLPSIVQSPLLLQVLTWFFPVYWTQMLCPPDYWESRRMEMHWGTPWRLWKNCQDVDSRRLASIYVYCSENLSNLGERHTEGRQKDREKENRKREGRGKRKGRKDQCKRKAFKQQQDKFCNFEMAVLLLLILASVMVNSSQTLWVISKDCIINPFNQKRLKKWIHTLAKTQTILFLTEH